MTASDIDHLALLVQAIRRADILLAGEPFASEVELAATLQAVVRAAEAVEIRRIGEMLVQIGMDQVIAGAQASSGIIQRVIGLPIGSAIQVDVADLRAWAARDLALAVEVRRLHRRASAGGR